MLPVYDPKSFASVDLRKYHIRSLKDAIRFLEFTASRMDEAKYVLKRESTRMATFKTLSSQLQKQLQKQQESYGNPNPDVQTTDEAVIQTAAHQEAAQTADEIHEDLLAEIRQAAADEAFEAQRASEEADKEALAERAEADFEAYVKSKKENREVRPFVVDGPYKLVLGKLRSGVPKLMYYHDSGTGLRLTAESNIPNKMKGRLISAIKRIDGVSEILEGYV